MKNLLCRLHQILYLYPAFFFFDGAVQANVVICQLKFAKVWERLPGYFVAHFSVEEGPQFHCPKVQLRIDSLEISKHPRTCLGMMSHSHLGARLGSSILQVRL